MSDITQVSGPIATDFRAAMRRLASTVSVITTQLDGKPYGMAATAVTSLCMQPPSLLVCVNSSASIHGPLQMAGRFCVNILSRSQTEVGNLFGGRYTQDERFQGAQWEMSEDGMPVLDDAQSAIVCELGGQLDYGTHTVFIGKVVAVHLNGEFDPLLYADGRYCTVNRAMESLAA